MVHVERTKSLDFKYVKKMKSLCNRCVFVWNLDTSKEIVPFCTRSSSSFGRNPLNLLAHDMWVKLWYDANFQPFQSSFAVLFNLSVILAQNKSWNAWKIANEIRKGLKSDDVALHGAYSMQKKSWLKICYKKWNSFVIDEFSSETLILRRRLSSLYMKCIHFFP